MPPDRRYRTGLRICHYGKVYWASMVGFFDLQGVQGLGLARVNWGHPIDRGAFVDSDGVALDAAQIGQRSLG